MEQRFCRLTSAYFFFSDDVEREKVPYIWLKLYANVITISHMNTRT